jgi:hypothetical protein
MRKNNRQFKINAIKEALNGKPEKLREFICDNAIPTVYFIDRENGTATSRRGDEVITLEDYENKKQFAKEYNLPFIEAFEFVKTKKSPHEKHGTV